MEAVVKLVGAAERVYDQIIDPVLKRSVDRVLGLLAQNPLYGDCVKRDIWRRSFDVPNLFRVELSGFWRLLYCIVTSEHQRVVVVIEICDHPTYDELFGYRKK